jgi:L-threonylcarbamoyladenylate synthase
MRQLPIMPLISSPTTATIKEAARSIRTGNLVSFPTETVYGLGADATNAQAIAKLYQAKGRPIDHPLIIHISSITNLDKWAREIPEYAKKLAQRFWPGPMTLILPRADTAKDFITGGQDNVAVRVPAHALAFALLSEFEALGGLGVAAPSANRFGQLSPTTADAVLEELFNYLSVDDLIIDGGPCQVGVESTIINCTQTVPEILRPGAVTAAMIFDQIGVSVSQNNKDIDDLKIKAPGLLKSHYAPLAKVFLATAPKPGDGFIALDNIPTPDGAIRLASPKNHTQYAQLLYQALRLGDQKGLQRIVVIPPTGDDIAIAICDRLEKSAYRI